MKLVAISDTHSLHNKETFPEIPEGDILVHAGDATRHGNVEELIEFLQWFGQQPHPYKIYVPGNHDRAIDSQFYFEKYIGLKPKEELLQQAAETAAKVMQHVPDGVTVLIDESLVIEDPDMTRSLTLYGSPFTPKYHSFNWAFLRNRGIPLEDKWSSIPDDTDILITHGPSYGHGDLAPPYGAPLPRHAGCLELLKRIINVEPKLHICGHIHCGYGAYQSDEIKTTFINASICDESYEPTHKPIVVDLDYI